MSYYVLNDDALKVIERLKQESKLEIFDAIITDPPYNISRDNNFRTIGRAGIDFGSWDYNFDQSTWIKNIHPLVKRGGSIIIFNDWKNMGEISKTLDESGFIVKDLIRWVKRNPMPRNTNRRYVTDFEFAIWAIKPGKKWTFNKASSSYSRPEYWESIVAKSKKKVHPTQKPIKLIENIIKAHTNKGDLILDPFMGSGSTGLAALNLHRSFFGIELDKKYFEKANSFLFESHSKKIKEKNVVRSPLYYLGDKYKLLPQIFSYFPKKINNFYDIFAGGGTLAANIQCKNYIYNDINKNLTSLVRWMYDNTTNDIIKQIETIIKKYNLTNPELFSRKSKEIKDLNNVNYKILKSDYNNLKYKDVNIGMAMLFVLVVYGFNSQLRFNSKGLFNIPVGKQDLNLDRKKTLVQFINAIRKNKMSFLSYDFEYFEPKKFKKDDFVYLDPPYSITNATYNNSWSNLDDERLFKYLDALNEEHIPWVLSNVLKANGQTNFTLKEWSKKYMTINLKYSYKNSNYQRKSLSSDEEVIITNINIKE